MAKEKYSQLAYIKVVESAADTLTFAGLSIFSNVLAQKGMIIHEAEYKVSPSDYNAINASGEGWNMGLTGDDSLDAISLDDPTVYDLHTWLRMDFGTAASGSFKETVVLRQWEGLPGGGLLVPADRLYGFVQGLNTGQTITVKIRVRYTIVELSSADYLELAQAMRVLR